MPPIVCDQVGAICVVKIHRPEALNALNRETLLELERFLKNPPQGCKAIILTGSGERAFIAGADIKEMNTMTPEEMNEFCLLGESVASLLENGPYITLAALNGYTLGGGLEMALACDFIYAAKTALLALPEVKLALIPGFGGVYRLSRRVGLGIAKEWIFSGKKISAQEALQWHLVNQVFAPEELLEKTLLTAQEILSHSFEALLQLKRIANASVLLESERCLTLERELCLLSFASKERKEAMERFSHKEKFSSHD